jgi:hypothetical protein
MYMFDITNFESFAVYNCITYVFKKNTSFIKHFINKGV